MPIPYRRTLPRFTLMLATLAGLSGPATAADPREELLALSKRWGKRTEVIATARLSGCRVTIDSLSRPTVDASSGQSGITFEHDVESSLTPGEMHALCDDGLTSAVASRGVVDAIQKTVDAFLKRHGRINGRDFHITVSELDVVQDGDVIKNEERLGRRRLVRKSTPDRFIDYDSCHRMATIGESGFRGDAYTAAAFRSESMGPISEAGLSSLRLEWLPGAHEYRLDVVNGPNVGSYWVVDAESDQIIHSSIRGDTGTVTHETWQARPFFIWDGIEFPSMVVDVEYEPSRQGEPRVSTAYLFIPIEMELNREIRLGELSVSVPQGTSILNQLQGGGNNQRVRTLKARQDIEDVTNVIFPFHDLGRGFTGE